MTTAPLAIRTAFRLSLTIVVIGAGAVSVATLYSTSHGARTALAAVLVPVGVILLMIVAAIALIFVLRPKRTVQQALLVVASSDTLLGLSASLRAQAVAIDAIVLLLLHARALVAARHRLAVVIPAAAGAAILVTMAGLRADSRSWLPILAVLMAAALLLLVAERSLPGHKLLPHWGRVGDLLQTLAAAALLPLTLWVLNLYAFVRSARG